MDEQWITMKSKYNSWCRQCGESIKKDTLIEWNKGTKSVKHNKCNKTRVHPSHRPTRGRARLITGKR